MASLRSEEKLGKTDGSALTQAPPGRREALPGGACGFAGAERRQEPSKRVKKELRLPKTGIEPVSNSYKGFVLTVKLFQLTQKGK